ncbi:MAG: iron-containing alcohol dehydrogenase, partial [Duncaniella sp.]|nr:iron-containing alcohol dehydrogenase [Duncaniella sp.]
MTDFSYCSPTRYIFGRDAEMKVAEQAKEMGATSVMMVYGMGSAVRSGLVGRVEKLLTDAGLKVTHLGGVQPNPVDTKVYEGIDKARSEGVDTVIAVGGGSAIDCAKAVAAGVCYDGDFWDFYCGKATVTKALPVGVVLTIPAAGSEGSGNSVITKTEGLIKSSIRTDYWLRPKFACLNPELTFTLPPFQTACGICDMMAHILERYFSPTPDVEVSDRLCEGLLMAIMTEAPKVIAKPDDYQARANILWSGTLAHNGICGCGRVEDWCSHALEHEISALYNVAHGAGLAVVFPAFITFMASVKPEKPAQFGRRVLGLKIEDD